MAELIPPPSSALEGTHCTAEQYDALYARSLSDPDGFWGEQAQRLDWFTAPAKIARRRTSFTAAALVDAATVQTTSADGRSDLALGIGTGHEPRG